MYGRSRDEVRRLLAEALAARESGTLNDARGMTIGAFLDVWLAEVAKPSVRHWTFKPYQLLQSANSENTATGNRPRELEAGGNGTIGGWSLQQLKAGPSMERLCPTSFTESWIGLDCRNVGSTTCGTRARRFWRRRKSRPALRWKSLGTRKSP